MEIKAYEEGKKKEHQYVKSALEKLFELFAKHDDSYKLPENLSPIDGWRDKRSVIGFIAYDDDGEPGGVILGQLFVDAWNKSHSYGQIGAMWVEAEHISTEMREKLLAEFERVVEDAGIRRCRLRPHLKDLDAADRFWSSHGYTTHHDCREKFLY